MSSNDECPVSESCNAKGTATYTIAGPSTWEPTLDYRVSPPLLQTRVSEIIYSRKLVADEPAKRKNSGIGQYSAAPNTGIETDFQEHCEIAPRTKRRKTEVTQAPELTEKRGEELSFTKCSHGILDAAALPTSPSTTEPLRQPFMFISQGDSDDSDVKDNDVSMFLEFTTKPLIQELSGDQVCSDSVRDDPNNINGKPCDKEQSGDSANRGTWKCDNEILKNSTDASKTLTVNGTIDTCGYKIMDDLEDLDFVDPFPPFYEVRNGPQVLITSKCNRDFLAWGNEIFTQELYDSDEWRSHIDKEFDTLVTYMNPIPVIDLFMKDKVYGRYSSIQDMKKIGNDIQINKHLLEFVKECDFSAYRKLKQYLVQTEQQILAILLEMAEKNEDTSYFKIEIREKHKHILPEDTFFEDFRADLITYYRENESNIPISPLVEEHDVPLMDFYVRPPIGLFIKPHILSESTGSRKPENDTAQLNKKLNEDQQTKITSYRKLFFQDNGTPFMKIYLTADAGMGKTSFSQHVTLYWCQSHKPVEQSAERYLKHDISAIKEFDLLFLLHLREWESSSKCNLDDLVIEMCSNLSRRSRYNREFLETVLHEKRCLIVLDGLDEWTHPSSCYRKPCVPHNNHPKNCTVLTTTRTWKFGTIGLSSAHIDRHVEILDFDSCSSNELENNVIAILKNRGPRATRLMIKDFHEAIASIQNDGTCKIPYIKLQLINLWYDGIPISKSRVEIYSNIIELTLTRGLKKSNIPLIQTSQQDVNDVVPKYMKNNTLCVQYINLISKLGQIAFSSLFSKTKKSMLIFDQDTVLQYLTETELEFSLKTGLLSQTKDSSRLAKLCYKVSFQHKSIQEFFAGLHISSERRNNITREILGVCQSLYDILELSNVFIFVSGMNQEQYLAISCELKNVVARDQIACSYRSMNDIPHRLEILRKIYPMTLYQNMQVACFKENLNMGSDECKLPIQDIFLNRYCDYSDSSALKKIVKFNAQSFKSINIDTCTSTFDVKSLQVYSPPTQNQFVHTSDVKVSTVFQILTGSTNSLTTVYFYNIGVPVDLLRRLYKCIADIRTLTVICMEHIRSVNLLHHGSQDLVLNVCKQSQLQHLYLTNIPLSGLDISRNSQLKQLLLSNVPLGELDLTKNSQLQHLYLVNIPISELDLSQTSQLEHIQLTKIRLDELDFSQFSQLQQLNLKDIHLNPFHVNAEYLQQCFISTCSLPHIYFYRLIESIQKSKNLKILVLENIQYSDLYQMGVCVPLNLCQHIQLQELQLDNILLSALDISQNSQLQKLKLNRLPLNVLDISQNSQLQKLQLNRIPISVQEITQNSKIEQLHQTAIALNEFMINAECLQEVEIQFSRCLLSHNNLHELVSSIQSAKNLESLTLENIECSDHEGKCTGFQLKLSQHIKLQNLNLCKIPITMLGISKSSQLQQLQIQNAPIKMLDITQTCRLWKLFLLEMPLAELHLPLTSKLRTLKLKKIRIHQLDLSKAYVLQKLHLEDIFLSGLDLSKNKLLNKIRLKKVHLTSGWSGFFRINANFQWSISV